MCPLRYSVFNGIAELTDACIFGKLLIKTGPGPLQLVKQHGQYHYIFNRTLFPNELSDDTTYHPGEEFGSVLLTKLNPAPPPWHCHLNEYEYVSDDPLLIMYFRSRRVNELADCSVIDGSMHVSTDDERTMFMPPSTSAIVGKYDERIKAFNLTQSRGGSGYAFFVEGKNSNGKIDLTREAVLISKPEGPIDSEMCRGQYSLKEREMKLIKDCEFEDLLTKFGSGSIKIEKRLEEYRYTFGKTTLLDEIADRITRYERKEIGPLILSRLDPTSPPSFCDTNKYEFVSDSPLLSMNFFFDKDDKIADCSVIEGTLQLPPVGKHSKTLATSTATITTIVGNWVDRTKAFVLTQGQGSSGYAFFVQIPKTGDPGIEAVLIVHWKDMRMILRQKERRQQDATA
ncbi:hypothetical protein FOL47_004792 [Perkinsus chesapeaki]|uniref:Uncharacterized protein n=1 Tax=Perkinsus chesapeaki TaxID=330153 RepID=A0A7J6M0M4_PERCH|nr:hypothetical protein FOL47_004792 [Perkinsus chesapeaki]